MPVGRAGGARLKRAAGERIETRQLQSIWLTIVIPGAAMPDTQTFLDSAQAQWSKIDFLPGVELLPLAEPVPTGLFIWRASRPAR
jgi:hypothetical protein